MSDKNIEPKGSFWTTAPGCITAIGGLVSVIVAAVVALSAAGFIQPPFQATATPHVVATVSNSSSSSIADNVPSAPDTEPPPTIPHRFLRLIQRFPKSNQLLSNSTIRVRCGIQIAIRSGRI